MTTNEARSARVAASPLPDVRTAAIGESSASPTRSGLTDDGYPALFRAADAASNRAHLAHTRLVGAELALLIAAAGIGALHALLPVTDAGWVRTVPAVLLVAALVVKLANRQQRFDERWFDGRAVAETVKSATWRYVMGVRPYEPDEAKSGAMFAQSLGEAVAARPALAAHLHHLPRRGRQIITEEVSRLRALSPDARRAVYLAARVDDQEAWYAGKSHANARSATVWFWASLICEGLALAAALIAATMGLRVDLVGFLAAVSAGATAWTQLGRHNELAKSYGLAAHELMLLRARLELAETDEAFRQGVEETEAAISREHTMWMAKRG
jgi:hypothetical protein